MKESKCCCGNKITGTPYAGGTCEECFARSLRQQRVTKNDEWRCIRKGKTRRLLASGFADRKAA